MIVIRLFHQGLSFEGFNFALPHRINESAEAACIEAFATVGERFVDVEEYPVFVELVHAGFGGAETTMGAVAEIFAWPPGLAYTRDMNSVYRGLRREAHGKFRDALVTALSKGLMALLNPTRLHVHVRALECASAT